MIYQFKNRHSHSHQPKGFRPASKLLPSSLVLMLVSSVTAASDGGITFQDVAKNDGAGISYRRTPSPRNHILEQLKQLPVLPLNDLPLIPAKPQGNPGVAVFDYDRDGDLDIYVTNGPGTNNSLYSNQFKQTGKVDFKDVGVAAGVGAAEQDSMGACFGDIDNDGDEDLYVLGSNEPKRLFENQGNRVFKDITETSHTGGGNRTSTTCSFGDVNGDGLLDLVVANLYNNMDNRLPIAVPGFENLIEQNQLFLNKGNNLFKDASQDSGIETAKSASWSIALVDYDLDGDVDLITADDQGIRLPARAGGKDYGYIRILQNNGRGKFTDVTEISGTNQAGDWMGLSFGDFNGDGHLDLFATNIGDHIAALFKPLIGLPTEPNAWSSKWFLGGMNNVFVDPGLGELGTTPLGWGTSTADYDNDGDLDIIFYGGMDMGIIVDATNPGTILQNNGQGIFNRDTTALKESTDHARRTVDGVAVGDLNNDGFIDIVSVASSDWPAEYPLAPMMDPSGLLSGQFDDVAWQWPVFSPVDPSNPNAGFTWNGLEPVQGTLAVELNSAANGNGWVRARLLGTRNVTSHGKVNRDGIGAVVTFHPESGGSVSKPIVSGGSQASADSLEVIFGLGENHVGNIEVLWPGGVRNRLYGVKNSESVVIPEIPCSFDDRTMGIRAYIGCVENSLRELREKHILNSKQVSRIKESALRAFHEVHEEHQSRDSDFEEKNGRKS